MRRWLLGTALLLFCVSGRAENVTISVRNAGIGEVIDMISRQQRVNVLVPAKLTGEISLNLYDVPVEKALAAVANAGGFALEKRGDNYFIVAHDEVGRYAGGNVTELRWFELNYTDGEKVKEMVESYLSRYGKVSFIANRNLLVVEDRPEFLRRVESLLAVIDKRPRQVMIEAKILEVTLNDDENFGIDWSDLFSGQDGEGEYGTQGFSAGPNAAGFFFNMVTPNVSVALNALRDEGRLRTLSTPKLVALENREASVVIGDRRGYQVTTTINQVTTESIEFLESGVILRVNVQIDEDERILMSVHPEVSNGTVDANGIPSQTTTEVTTNLLIPSGETVFIGGLIKKSEVDRRRSVPGLNRIPVVRRLFSGTENSQITTETVVLITPVLAEDTRQSWNQAPIRRVEDSPIPSPDYRVWHPLTLRDDKPSGTRLVENELPAVLPLADKVLEKDVLPEPVTADLADPAPVTAEAEAIEGVEETPDAVDSSTATATATATADPVIDERDADVTEAVPEVVEKKVDREADQKFEQEAERESEQESEQEAGQEDEHEAEQVAEKIPGRDGVEDVVRKRPAQTEVKPELQSKFVPEPKPAPQPAQTGKTTPDSPVEVAGVTTGVRWLN